MIRHHQPPIEDVVRWNVKVSKDIDRDLRALLDAQGVRKGGISKFVENAVRWQLLQDTVKDIWRRNASADPDEIQKIVDEARSEVRAERRARKK